MRVFGMVTTKTSEAYTTHALDTFIRTTPLRPFDKFILIDNDKSFGELPEQLKKNGEKISNLHPKSFSANVNDTMAIALANRADLFFLHNDLIFTPQWLEPLLIPEIAILSSFSNHEVQHSYKNFTWTHSLSLEDYLARIEECEEVARLHRQSVSGSEQVLSLPFFCIKIPYFVYSELGPLNENLGINSSEDYCRRASDRNIPIRYQAQSFILHFNKNTSV